MRIERDLHIIAKLAKERYEENCNFRIFLKCKDIEIEELDGIVHNLNEEISSQIDCTDCANCCKTVYPVLDDKDISKFAFGLKMNLNEFKNKYLTEDKDLPEGKIFNKLPCPFLKDKLCTNYEHRPKACISFPHLHKDEFLFRLWDVIDNYAICPIAFNVYEKLKLDLWHYNDES